MKIITLLFEGFEKDFIKNILIQKYNFSAPLKSNNKIENGSTRIIFVDTGGKSSFMEKGTYIACRNLSEGAFHWGEEKILPIRYILLRDSDSIKTDDAETWARLAQPYHDLFQSASCHHNGRLDVQYCQRKAENWYIAGLSPEHFGLSRLFHSRHQEELLSSKNAENYYIDDHLRSYLNDGGVGCKEIALRVAQDFSIDRAKQRSRTFREYIMLIESLL